MRVAVKSHALPETTIFLTHYIWNNTCILLHLKCYMHIPITIRIRSIVDESLVHCYRGCEFEPRHFTFLFIFSIY